MIYEDYSEEVKFQVGQRVDVDLPYVKIEDRDVTTGIIILIGTRFFATKEHRRIYHTIRLDNKNFYIKHEKLITGIDVGPEITVPAEYLKSIK